MAIMHSRIAKPCLRRKRTQALGSLLFWAGLASANWARASESAQASTEATQQREPARRRYEFLPVPNLGGNNDVGVELGVAFTLARFYDEQYPYRWLLGGVFSASVKDDADGFRAIQQFHLVRFDLPNLLSGRLRLDNRLSFSRNILGHYYGLGNASVPGQVAPGANPARQNEYISQELRFRSLARVKTGTIFDAAFALNLRYDTPSVYPDSRLVTDVAHDGVVGSKHALLSTLAAGVILDTRDNEFVPRHGVYYQLGAAGTLGSAERVAYGEVGTNLASYISLARPVIFATRVITSFQFGRVPFYDAQQTNVLSPQYMVGSAIGVRGIPLGRYAGHIKVLANYELRTLFIPRFRVAAWQLQVGTTTFFDAGRVWSNYDTPELDGTKLGLKYGAGGGFFFQFDRSSIFRAEAAYSPHTRYQGVPFAWYLSNALIF